MRFWKNSIYRVIIYRVIGTNYFNDLKMRDIFHATFAFAYDRLYIGNIRQHVKVINIVFYRPKKIISDLPT